MNNLFVPFNPNGRPPKYTPKQLLTKFGEYVEDRKSRPIYEEENEEGSYGKSKNSRTKKVSHPQLLSIADFCVYLGCSRNWWNGLSDDFSGVKSHISTYLENFQLKGASVGVFNANIVSRLLGLKDKTELTGNGIVLKVTTDQETKELIEGGLG